MIVFLLYLFKKVRAEVIGFRGRVVGFRVRFTLQG
jgi:hypothetical protein